MRLKSHQTCHLLLRNFFLAMIMSAISYLDTFSLDIASKAKGRLRSSMEVDFAFGDDLSFNFSIDAAVDEEHISCFNSWVF